MTAATGPTASSDDTRVAVGPVRAENHAPGEAVGIGEERPRLSWAVLAPPRWRQQDYEVELRRGDDVEVHGPFADTDSLYRPWPGRPLLPRERAVVRVRVRGVDGGFSPWSGPEPVERGLAAADWVAVPVGSPADEDPDSDRRPALVRRDFTVRAEVVAARVYVTSHGLHELEVNGYRVGTDVLSPGWSPYATRLRYLTHDVTDLLVPGANAIGGLLGDGWYRGRLGFRGGHRNLYGTDLSLIAQLEIEYADGERDVVATDAAWRAAPSPIVVSGLYDGETYDARDERPGWSRSGFDDAGWLPVALGHRDPATLAAPDGPPVRCTEECAPVTLERRAPDRLVVDMGRNLAGRFAVRATGGAGDVLRIRHAEVLQDGELYTRPLRTARATDVYVFAGGPATWEPRFTYHGFRYAEVTAPPGVLDTLELRAHVLHSDMDRTGTFACSDPDVTTLHDNVVRSMQGNFVDVPTDCPQRDERLGWTGDIQVFAPTATFLYETTGMLSSWLRDLAIEQLDDGTVPWFVPVVPTGERWTPPRPGAAWGDAGVLTPWDVFHASGDSEILRRQWDSARRWVDLVADRAGPDRLWTGDFQLGDWLDPAAPPDDPFAATTDPDLVASAYLARSAGRLAEIATVLGREDDATGYRALAREVRAAVRDRYLSPEGRLAQESQTGYALVVAFGLTDDPVQLATAGRRLRALVEEAGHRIATGFVGTPLVTAALTATGSLDTAYRLLGQTECPSWLYPVTRGATTVWERWDSLCPDGTVNPGEMTSFNHYALGAVAHWLHTTVAGIEAAAPGWRAVRFAPRPGGGLSWARAEHRSPYGRVAVAWRIEEGTLSVTTVVPTGSTARLELPDGTVVELGPGQATHTCPAA
ncbi:glycoside hydrolase family 78 protein [Pseudonocardia sp. DR1-2]|uniref:glycoside hydrolase family 78 protein n=1 Tax=Pseudonocardia sp. DR1-2 TaxID=2951168 RepID=UPI002044556B|nr:glycoside hydrolase family 78 protein [Pseudonocardia sp. DR1-2]MCM3848303.1 glycoside hydrolase family 78 protein [Pseudonocardia sp. DR1-2]